MSKQTPLFLGLLDTAIEAIKNASNNAQINTIIEEFLVQFTESSSATLFIFDEENHVLHSKKENDIPFEIIRTKSLLNEAFLTKTPAFYNHILSEKYYLPKIDNPNNLKLKSQIIFPLVIQDEKLIGIVRVSRESSSKKVYTKHDLELIESISSFLIHTIHTLLSESLSSTLNSQSINEKVSQVKEHANPQENAELNATMMFLSNTVHDIRTPANSLHGFLELMEEHTHDARMKVFIQNAKESAKFINTLTDSILEKVKDKQEVSQKETVHSINFFAQTANIFTGNMFEKEINYCIYLDSSLPKEIYIDAFKLKRVIINLIGNAYKFTPLGKQIKFRVLFDAKNTKLNIFVIDQGIGIDKSKQSQIFEAFKQAEEDTSVHFGGTGLGLSISSRYVQELGGELHLESELGQGANFHFSIPIKVINTSTSYEKFQDISKKVCILTDSVEGNCANNIQSILIELGLPASHISIQTQMQDKISHLFCFQHKITDALLAHVSRHHIKLIFVEEVLFSLSQDVKTKDFDIISKNTYFGETIHTALFSQKKTKILIADDNKINIFLLKSMLETEFVEIDQALDAEEALSKLKQASQENQAFDMIYLDKHMPKMSGSQMLQEFREFERQTKAKPIFAISITGDNTIDDKEKSLYNSFMYKPFNKQVVRESVHLV